MLEARIGRLREAFAGKCDAVLLTSDIARLYFSGLSTSAGRILVTGTNAYYFADFRYYELVKKKVPHILAVSDKNELGVTLADILELEKVKALGFEDRRVTVAEFERMKSAYPGLSFVPLGDTVERLRGVKDGGEQTAMMAAQRIADEAFVHLLPFIRPRRTELEIRDELERLMKQYGSDGPAFPTIVLSGAKTSMPHGQPDTKKVEEGDFVLMDFGATKDHYLSDMTRTVAVGSATEEMRAVYASVLGAQRHALENLKAGMTGAEIDALARDRINADGYEGTFGHALGHSVGLEIHESPNFSPACKEEIPVGAVVTVEPGIYLEGKFGVRIEDIVICEDGGCNNLTASPKELMILGKE